MKFTPSISTARGVEVERDGEKVRVFRLNPGCGARKFHDCCNVDISEKWGADFVVDIDNPHSWWRAVGRENYVPLFAEDTFDSVYCSHTLEHLRNPLIFMQELHRICVDKAMAIFKVPYGSSDNAWEDPTHVRPYFLDSFGYFAQSAYAGADYGYKGDWRIVERELLIRGGLELEELKDDLERLMGLVMSQRNVVEEMKVIVQCVKPAREPGTSREAAPIMFKFHRVEAANEAPPAKNGTTNG